MLAMCMWVGRHHLGTRRSVGEGRLRMVLHGGGLKKKNITRIQMVPLTEDGRG